jgi:hypothetical protein
MERKDWFAPDYDGFSIFDLLRRKASDWQAANKRETRN